MIIKEFEQFLYRDPSKDGEVFWDSRATHFAEAFSNENNRDEALIEMVEQRGILSEVHTMVDVGCGVGRHASYFSKHVDEYLGIDFSGEMIRISKEMKEKHALSNCEFKKCSLQEVQGDFDLVFSAMCPAIQTVEDVEKLLSLSNRFVLVKRFLSDTDSILETMGIVQKGAHNNPQYTYGLINILWQRGYVPEIHTVKEDKNTLLPLETIREKYRKVLDEYSENEQAEMLRLVEALADDNGQVKCVKKARYAFVLVDKDFNDFSV